MSDEMKQIQNLLIEYNTKVMEEEVTGKEFDREKFKRELTEFMEKYNLKDLQ